MNDIDIASAEWTSGMFFSPNESFSVSQVNALANNSGFLCRSFETLLTGICRIDGTRDGSYQIQTLLAPGTYLFQASVYSVDGEVSWGTLRVGTVSLVKTKFTSAGSACGSGTLVVSTLARYAIAYEGSRKTTGVDTYHFVWVGYRRLYQGTA